MAKESVMFRNQAARQVIQSEFERFLLQSPAAESRRVTTRFGDTHLLVYGTQAGPPLVVTGGAMASSAHALRELHALAKHFRLYVLDVIGQSVKSADVRLDLDGDAYGLWLTDVLDALKLTQPVHLLGVSYGGMVARKFAETAPSRIDRLALLVPAGIVAGSPLRGFVESALPLLLYRAFHLQRGLSKFVSSQTTSTDSDWQEYFGHALLSYNLDIRVPPLAKAEKLAAFKRPTLVLATDDDVNFPGVALLQRVKQLIPQCETEMITGSKHMPATDETFRQWFAARLVAFYLP